jgi:hypothetical protein
MADVTDVVYASPPKNRKGDVPLNSFLINMKRGDAIEDLRLRV